MCTAVLAILSMLGGCGGEPGVPVKRAPDVGFETLRDASPPVRAAAPEAAPHVVLVIGCTVRRDQVSSYGGPPTTTPFLDAHATRGTRFVDPIAAAPWTRAASTAILTGRHALEVGLVEPGALRSDRALPDEVQTLAEHFRAAGYETLGATANPNLNGIFGFQQGYDRYLQARTLWRDGGGKVDGDALVGAILEALDTREAPQRPLLLTAMLVDAHAPFRVSDAETAAQDGEGVPDEVARYRAALRQVDASIEALHDGLVQRGFDTRNTLFVVVSDHGEGLSWPEHHGRSHGRYLYPSVVEGIFQITGPDVPVGTVRGVVSQIDYPATLAGLAGVTPFPFGTDHGPAVRASGSSTRPRAIVDTWFMQEDRVGSFRADEACLIDLSGRPSRAPTGRFLPGCFDRRADPEFLRPTARAERTAELIRWRADRAGRAGRSSPAEVDADVAAQLEALGYRQEDAE